MFLGDDKNAEFDADALAATLAEMENPLTRLVHVKPQAEIRRAEIKNAAEEIAQRTPCRDFAQFKPLFDAVKRELTNGRRQIRSISERYKGDIRVGNFFILGGQILYIAYIDNKAYKPEEKGLNARMRVIYANATESNLLLDSLRRALDKDKTSAVITNPDAGSLFSDVVKEGDQATGTLYVLRSLSDHPYIQQHRDLIHKIGITGNDVQKRLANAPKEATFLCAEVKIVQTYTLYNINRIRMENFIHKFLAPAQLQITIKDRFGNPFTPREWFMVPLFVIDEIVERLKNNTLEEYHYDPQKAALVRR
ncbi:MAG: GIY-YIG nuclease family protein [Acetobacter sp.]|nr:GIY-YIG nuclease family protein [Acetobacter sp.]